MPSPRPRFGEGRDELAAIWSRLDHLAVFVDEARPLLWRLDRHRAGAADPDAAADRQAAMLAGLQQTYGYLQAVNAKLDEITITLARVDRLLDAAERNPIVKRFLGL